MTDKPYMTLHRWRRSGIYAVYSNGRIVNHHTGEHATPEVMSNGYECLRIPLRRRSRRGRRYRFVAVHRLIAGLFIPNPGNKPIVNHKNGQKSDNRAKNLEWVTPSENQRHAIDTGLRKVKVSSLQREEICRLWKSGEFTQKELAVQFEISPGYVSKIVNKAIAG